MLASDMDTGELEYISRFIKKMLMTRDSDHEKDLKKKQVWDNVVVFLISTLHSLCLSNSHTEDLVEII
jgi:hypothetical protein